MEFFKKFSNKPTPKEVAKDRLKLILIHDRGDLPQETLEKIRVEILAVISKYIEIDVDDVEIAVSKSESVDGNSPSLVANIPIRNVKGR
ncbi:cell division topological specificity factor MinE [Clostridium gasigenes]|uniref:Cell division topological specificity factor n=1 Tax=Clostridium gasigenes TaxID=94869 RepID=A0A1H0S1A9_9CLOT|nr:cell division topological specificity factor MinE [Clostridium gasigenes]MBB6622676.1 cell division topological specificity factor MinE [Clostridium gasigenes]MBB6714274.1 cell division topological specificity factor MinE [Clostridium gasigenes]MBU3088608.1 cell division topological specificity factor MinE [Clostridium gasigenes]MBU3103795.1 cell division topological specificity factor MinE [Clostridium gasigenes]MBU3108253.1 cell division topological specificity factor MinE [Clostridium ga